MPRYKTGDRVYYDDENGPCRGVIGRVLPRADVITVPGVCRNNPDVDAFFVEFTHGGDYIMTIAESLVHPVTQLKMISQQLKEAITTSGMSTYALAKRTGIDKSQLSRFINGKGGLSVTTIDVLCATLGLQLSGAD